ncbi:DUF2931 family protein, partial [Lonsdalea quercina]|uniref:DUF2931 family protein n=1 Tax=Lonsdalea quercina TaxID=71657 RepID=UPI003975AFDC
MDQWHRFYTDSPFTVSRGIRYALVSYSITPSGSNIDSFCTTKVTFYLHGKTVFSYPGGGCNAGAPYKDIIEKKYYWSGGGGLPTDGVPVPDKAEIEMVSFHDRKRYRIKVDLPADLAQ